MDIHNFTPLQYAANKKYLKDEEGNRIPRADHDACRMLARRPLDACHAGKMCIRDRIYGSACVMGEFFRAVLAGKSDEELIEIDVYKRQDAGNA